MEFDSIGGCIGMFLTCVTQTFPINIINNNNKKQISLLPKNSLATNGKHASHDELYWLNTVDFL